ncbi:Aspartic peptidase domain protein [Raphanus sativus]|nr:Aspartic peptidase domain protein [Raphanus sativus]
MKPQLCTLTPYTVLHTSIYKALVTVFVVTTKMAAVKPFGACFRSNGGCRVPVIDLFLSGWANQLSNVRSQHKLDHRNSTFSVGAESGTERLHSQRFNHLSTSGEDCRKGLVNGSVKGCVRS